MTNVNTDINQKISHKNVDAGSSPALSPCNIEDISQSQIIELQNRQMESFIDKKQLTLIVRLENVLVDIVQWSSKQELEILIPNSYHDSFIQINDPTPTLVRLRPGLDHFLKLLNGIYQISLISNLDKAIVNHIVQKIDPTKTVFGNRVYSDADFNFIFKSTNSALFPATTSLAVILDTSSERWKNENGFNYSGFVFISPYHYFNHNSTISVSETLILPSVTKMDSILYGISKYLQQLHIFYYGKKVDSIVLAIGFAQYPIFKSCYICIPDINPSQQKDFEILISRFGGKLITTYDSSVTHLIVSSRLDPTIQEAKQYNGVHIITLGWLIDSCTQYERKDERDYPIIGITSPTCGPSPIEQLSVEASSDHSSADNEYDDSSDFSSDEELGHASDEEF